MRVDACFLEGLLHAGGRDQLAPFDRLQGRGLAGEAARAVLDCASGPLGLGRVVAFTVATNTPSLRLMGRLGMQKIGEFDNSGLPEGHPLRRNVVCEILAP